MAGTERAGARKPPESVWTRPARARREQPTLTRGQIVDAALELLDAEGLDGLSMRRLGTRLNSGATSVYWHVANKDELLELALDRVMGEVRVPPGDGGDGDDGWRDAVAGYARSLRTMIHRHPWTVPLFGVQPMIGPNATRVLDEVIAAFDGAGLAGMDLENAMSLVADYVIGAAGSEASWQNAHDAATGEDWLETLAPYLAEIADRHPRLTAHVREVWARETADVLEQRFDYGLSCVLAGIEAHRPR
ncbi:TetR/AcrR family transcriptional regulator [Actinomadura opuntiae]|uniref:TetR/AcrR family transcriptional regulator n=1 Tax=Actinomadura sp. OS1-43 TaxID=604315 RepID=UPI00255A784A|nr:TetR/AcrR family transcriptional regulator C-terminal domain-containing protein [Actinomadura sp. OS1-43]MDL4813380.1 TetR/AcrR family transcriptional regulator C-terminal domain-containing protein [Actinomadura sp. OS1-43]